MKEPCIETLFAMAITDKISRFLGNAGDSAGRRRFEQLRAAIVDGRMFIAGANRSEIAAVTGLSRSAVEILIREHAGCSVNEYINRLRVEYSATLLVEHPEWSVEAVAESSGYRNRGTYYANFEKIYGVTPTRYRLDYAARNAREDAQPNFFAKLTKCFKMFIGLVFLLGFCQ